MSNDLDLIVFSVIAIPLNIMFFYWIYSYLFKKPTESEPKYNPESKQLEKKPLSSEEQEKIMKDRKSTAWTIVKWILGITVVGWTLIILGHILANTKSIHVDLPWHPENRRRDDTPLIERPLKGETIPLSWAGAPAPKERYAVQRKVVDYGKKRALSWLDPIQRNLRQKSVMPEQMYDDEKIWGKVNPLGGWENQYLGPVEIEMQTFPKN